MSQPSYTALRQEYNLLANKYNVIWKNYLHKSMMKTFDHYQMVQSQKESLQWLDIGCGTALLEQVFQQQLNSKPLNPKQRTSFNYAGIDLSHKMLQEAKRISPSLLLEASAEQLPFADHSFDLITCVSVFHYIESQHTALQEIKRVLKPNGKLILTDWCADFFIMKIQNRFLQLFDPAHHKSHTLLSIVDLFKRSNFSVIHSEKYKVNWYWGLMTLTLQHFKV